MKTMRNKSLTSCLIAASILITLSACTKGHQPDMSYYRNVVSELSSPAYQGRGYAHDGVIKTSAYLQQQYRRAGVTSVETQPFTFPVNTHGGVTELSIGNKRLVAGDEWTVREFSPAISGTFPLYILDTLTYDPARVMADLQQPEYCGAFVVCDYFQSRRFRPVITSVQRDTALASSGVIFLWEHPEQRKLAYEPYQSAGGGFDATTTLPLKYYKAESSSVRLRPDVWVRTDAFNKAIEETTSQQGLTVTIDIENHFYKNYATENVIARVAGERHDSCYVLTAHYDHLGNLGSEVFYPGANDNASGTAALLTLARYFSRHRPPFDILFLSVSGEDCGLYGSTYYAEHPLVPLNQVKYLINIDMIGDNNPVLYSEASDEGLEGWRRFDQLNTQHHYFQSIERGDLAANSDHYPFAMQHVPCIFFENEHGDAFPYYHTPLDDIHTICFDSALPVMQLVIDFIRN